MSGRFPNLLERLVRADVDLVVVGGFAGVVHGCTYVTQDIDICCDFAPANLLALQKALGDLHPVHRMTPGRKKLELTAENCTQFKNLYLDALIKTKRAMNRPRDREVLLQLEAIKQLRREPR